MSGVNLHGIVRGPINMLHPDTSVVLYRSTGQVVVTGGQVKSIYAPGEPIKAQMQSEGASVLYHSDRVGMEEVSRKFYLFSDADMQSRVAGIVRPLTRNGDMFQVSPDETWYAGTWWLVQGIIEDFTRSGWANVRATLQVNPPDFSHSEWWTP